MREMAAGKLPKDAAVLDGDFLDFPAPPFSPDTIVSSYAFHHLTNEEKREAVRQYGKMLRKHGKIVFADTVFKDRKAFHSAVKDAEKKGFTNWRKTLKRNIIRRFPRWKRSLPQNISVSPFKSIMILSG